jgi:hypothetical protein
MSVQQRPLLEEIRELTEANRAVPDTAREQRLAVLRHQAWSEVERPAPEGLWPPQAPDALAGTTGLPDMPFADVTADVLRSAVFEHGALLARGLFGPELVDRINADIESTMSFVDALAGGQARMGDAPEWFTPLEVEGYEGVGGLERMWVLNSGTVWAADSPRTLFDIIEAIEVVGLGGLLTEVFGLRPSLSVTKFAMRKVPPDTMGGWHQDGYVLGPQTRTLNVWVALSHCGDRAPGLDVLPTRMNRVVETAVAPPLDFIVADETVDQLAIDTPVVRPTFEPGDALVFDQFLLHQTGWGPGLVEPRFGLECWFFCPSTFPVELAPLVF